MQASCPIDPDDQRTELLSRINIEMNKPVKVESLRKIYELINCVSAGEKHEKLLNFNDQLLWQYHYLEFHLRVEALI